MGKSNFQILYNKIEKTERFAIAQMNEKQRWFGPVLMTGHCSVGTLLQYQVA